MEENYIVERIKQLCEEKNMSQYEVAKRAGITQSSMSNLMNRGSQPRVDTLGKVCHGLGISLAQFFAPPGEYPDLTEEQKAHLRNWDSLSPKEKTANDKIMSSIKDLR